MNNWIKNGFFVIKRKVKSSDGYTSFQPILEKQNDKLHALLIQEKYEEAEFSIKTNFSNTIKYEIVEENLDFYDRLQDDFEKYSIKVALKVVINKR